MFKTLTMIKKYLLNFEDDYNIKDKILQTVNELTELDSNLTHSQLEIGSNSPFSI